MADQTLLPANATAWERALAATFVRVQALPAAIITTVKAPATCPAALLPWLAVEHGVREWDPAWPEAQRRAVIDGSYALKSRNATRWAVVQSLRQLGFAVTYQSWMQYGGAPYRFRLTVKLDQNTTWSPAQFKVLLNTVFKAKAVRSRLDRISLSRAPAPGPVAVGGALRMQLTLTTVAAPITLIAPPSGYVRPAAYTTLSPRTVLQ